MTGTSTLPRRLQLQGCKAMQTAVLHICPCSLPLLGYRCSYEGGA